MRRPYGRCLFNTAVARKIPFTQNSSLADCIFLILLVPDPDTCSGTIKSLATSAIVYPPAPDGTGIAFGTEAAIAGFLGAFFASEGELNWSSCDQPCFYRTGLCCSNAPQVDDCNESQVRANEENVVPHEFVVEGGCGTISPRAETRQDRA
jgi:hypothetical protein